MGQKSHFCQFCQSMQPVYEYEEHGQTKSRCQTCGLPQDAPRLDRRMLTAESSSSARSRVLLIDDDQLLLGLLSKVLKEEGFELLTATTGYRAIELVKKEHPDLILLDVMMPGMSGFEVCRRLRSDPDSKDTPIIIITAVHDPQLNIKGFKAGATLAMRKPLETEALLDVVRTALALKAKPAGI